MKKRQRRAATLADVITIVLSGSVLTAAVLPALNAARTQSHQAICLQNLRTIGQAAQGYIADNGTICFAFPFDYTPEGAENDVNWQDFGVVSEFVWGGGLPDPRRRSWNPENGENPQGEGGGHAGADIYFILESERPLNQYISPGVWWCDPERRGVANPLRRQRPMQLPDFFKCPSDCTPSVPMIGASPTSEDGALPEESDPTWKWWGTSYAINWYWAHYHTRGGSGLNLIGYGGNQGALDGQSHRQILADKMEQGASEWVLFMENRLNYALEGAAPRGVESSYDALSLQGWHGRQDTHSAVYYDGSARSRRMDTRFIDGPGWTVWPNKPWDLEPWDEYQDN